MTTEERIAKEMQESIENSVTERLFGPTNCYAGPSLSGITLKDIRDAVLKMPHVPKIEYVRVSDAWWVCLEDGKPISSSPHNHLMKAIEEVSRHNTGTHRREAAAGDVEMQTSAATAASRSVQ